MTPNQKRVLIPVGIILTIAIVALIVFATLNGGSGTDERIRIGAVLPLTGQLAFLGEGDRNALLLYAQEHPDVEFVFGDSQGEARAGLSAARRMLNQGIQYYVTSLSYIANTLQPVLDEAGALNFTLNMDARTEERSSYTMRLYVTFRDEMDALFTLADTTNAVSVAVLYANTETVSDVVNNYLRPQLEEAGIQFRAEPFDLGILDYRSVIARLGSQQDPPDILRIVDMEGKLHTLLTQVEQSGRFGSTTLVSGVETLVIDYASLPASIKDRFLFTAPDVLLSSDNPVVAAYEERYGSSPTFDAMFAYDMANILVPAIKLNGYGNVDAVIDDIVSRRRFTGAASEYTINEHGGISPEIHWARISDSDIIFKDTVHIDR